jgi:PAS domain S-box-containing protein
VASLARFGGEPVPLTTDLHQLFELAPGYVVVLRGPDHVVELANAAYRRLIGERDIIGKPVREALPEVADQGFGDILDKVYRTGEPFTADATRTRILRGPDLEPEDRFFSFVYQPLFAEDGSVTGIFAQGVDVTGAIERIETEHRIKHSEFRDRALFEQAAAGISEVDHTGRFLRVNERFCRITGRSPEELLGLTMQEITHPDDLAGNLPLFRRSVEGGEAFDIEKRYVRPDRSIVWVHNSVTTLRDDDGKLINTICVTVDITERRRAEAELRRLNRELEQRVAGAVAENERAQEALRQSQKLEAVGQLTGGVAHDFNNLLTVIRGSVDLLRRRDLPEEKRRRYIDAISDTADRAAKLTSQLLAFARRQALRPERFNAAERVRSVTDMLRTLLGSGIALELELRCEDCFIEADAAQFETALVNMAVNARDAMEGEGSLTFAVEQVEALPPVRGEPAVDGAYVAVTIRDTGSGIPPHALDRIFEPFFTTKALGKGTGLGLSQVYGFAKQSGGEVAVDSVAGEGTTFTLYLPRAEAGAAAEPELRSAASEAPGRGCILVVEDNPDVGEFATQLLEDLGYETFYAPNGQEALARLEVEAARFNLVFTDVVMPGMTGLDLAGRIRERWPHLPVVLTSGYSHVLAEETGHGFPLLHKPYSVEKLSGAIRAELSRKRTGRLA